MNLSSAEGLSQPVWIAVNAHQNHERTAEQNLRNQDYEPYCPVIRKQIRHARRMSETLRPLFPGYLFVRLEAGQGRWRPILSTIGVRSVVRTGDAPCAVPNQFIDELKAREEDGAIARPASCRQIGDTVRIAHGAFDGFVGKIIGLSENDRLIVLMDFLNRPVRVKVSSDLLSVA